MRPLVQRAVELKKGRLLCISAQPNSCWRPAPPSPPQDSPVAQFNGQKVHNLAQLARMVRDSTDRYLRFDLEAANRVGGWRRGGGKGVWGQGVCGMEQVTRGAAEAAGVHLTCAEGLPAPFQRAPCPLHAAQVVVLDAEAARRCTHRIMDDHSIGRQAQQHGGSVCHMLESACWCGSRVHWQSCVHRHPTKVSLPLLLLLQAHEQGC